jgi:hypothetical protein
MPELYEVNLKVNVVANDINEAGVLTRTLVYNARHDLGYADIIGDTVESSIEDSVGTIHTCVEDIS